MTKKKTVWVVSKYVSGENGCIVWDLQGVFSTEEKALEACLDPDPDSEAKYRWDYSIGPTELDAAFPYENILWEGYYYPCEKD